MATIFSRIAKGEIPSYRVAENDRFYAFLDINPVAPGHVLVIPKREVDYLFDLDDEEFAALELFAKRIAEGMKKAMPCKRIGTAAIGLEVPHAHIHLIPLNSEADMDFRAPKKTLPEQEMKRIAEAINATLPKDIR
ncbi:MAG: HIT family protein [Muribaculaceae bacterium]|nr:HIT family protein [Muribaculaceae bacterium]